MEFKSTKAMFYPSLKLRESTQRTSKQNQMYCSSRILTVRIRARGIHKSKYLPTSQVIGN
jgi:hypothetical protein